MKINKILNLLLLLCVSININHLKRNLMSYYLQRRFLFIVILTLLQSQRATTASGGCLDSANKFPLVSGTGSDYQFESIAFDINEVSHDMVIGGKVTNIMSG